MSEEYVKAYLPGCSRRHHRRHYRRRAFCRFPFLATFIDGSVGRPQNSSPMYDLQTRRKAHTTILNIQASTDATRGWCILSRLESR